jgi:hypothetical protein
MRQVFVRRRCSGLRLAPMSGFFGEKQADATKGCGIARQKWLIF